MSVRGFVIAACVVALGACAPAGEEEESPGGNGGEGGAAGMPAGGAGGGGTDRSTYPASGYGEEEGDVLANLSFVRSDGTPYTMESVYKDSGNKVLLITTTAGWCVACIEEQPVLEEMHREFSGKGLEIMIAIFEDSDFEPATTEDAIAWKDRFNLTPAVVVDAPFVLAAYYDRNLTPMNMIVDVDSMEILSIAAGWDETAVRAIVESRL